MTPVSATHVACLTPPGRAALATLAVRGPQAWKMAQHLFRPAGARLPDQPIVGQFWFGRLGADLADEVVLTVQRGGPAAWLEIHCHGGPEAVRLLDELLVSEGAQSCSWEELLRHYAQPGTRACAERELTRAPTVRTASILLDQAQGALDRTLQDIRTALEKRDRCEAEHLLDGLARYVSIGRRLTRPWQVVVAGPPNVGKSSMVNALAGFQRSIVSATPGTTRDVVTTSIAVDGWPVELADTAGLREPGDDLESSGIDRAQQAAAKADLCLWLLDASTQPLGPPPGLSAVHLVVNKVDLPPAWDISQAHDAAHVSARTGTGLEDLCGMLSRRLVPAPPPPGVAVPFTDSLCAQILDLQQLVHRGQLATAQAGVDAWSLV